MNPSGQILGRDFKDIEFLLLSLGDLGICRDIEDLVEFNDDDNDEDLAWK